MDLIYTIATSSKVQPVLGLTHSINVPSNGSDFNVVFSLRFIVDVCFSMIPFNCLWGSEGEEEEREGRENDKEEEKGEKEKNKEKVSGLFHSKLTGLLE